MIKDTGADSNGVSAHIRDIKERINDAYEHDRDNRQEMVTDLRFLANDQWPAEVRRERIASGRPMLTINRLPQFIRQITNDIRQADLAIKAQPVGDEDRHLAKLYDGILRQIHNRSGAGHVYSMAAEHQVGCSIGWWRVKTQYVDDNSFDQELALSLIKSPLGVYCDPAAVLPDRSDAQWIAVVDLMPMSAFKRKYPKASLTGMDTPDDGQKSSLYWANGDSVAVCEFWEKVPLKRTLVRMKDGSIHFLDDFPKELHKVLPIDISREVDTHKVKQTICNGSEVLEDSPEWPGKYIPIVAAVGGEFPLEDRTYRYGAIRFARDAQQLYNYNRTASAEAIAMQPKAPYLVEYDSISAYRQYWDTANKSNRPYLPYDSKNGTLPPPKREAPPAFPAAFANEAQLAQDDMKATTGIYDAALGARSNEQSGKAILARQHEGDVSNFHFLDNLTRSLEHTGRILIDLIPKIYDNERVMRLLGEDGKTETPVTINQVVIGQDGFPELVNDLSVARFDVRAVVGKSYSTKRMEQADSLMQFIQAVPAAGEVAADLIAASMDWDGAEELAKRLKALVPPEILQAAEADPDQPPPPQPPPQPSPLEEAEVAAKQASAAKDTASAKKIMEEAVALRVSNDTDPISQEPALVGQPQPEPGPF